MEDLVAALQQLTAETEIAGMSLEGAIRAEASVKDALTLVKRSISTPDPKETDAAYKEALRLTLEQAPIIYAAEVADAVTKAPEYAYDQFLSPLLEVGLDSSLYSIIPNGVGWARTVSVTLNMDEVAGTIADYAEGVESARGSLGTKDSRDPEMASTIWRTRIYKKSRYFTTIQLRLLAATGLAPFWSLLNYGSKNVSMDSDIGGSPYPSRGGHHFVEHTEDKIRMFFNQTFLQFKNNVKDSPAIKEAIIEAERLLSNLQNLIDRLSRESEFIAKIAREINVNVSQLNASKILIAADRIRSGDIFTTQIVVGDGIRIRTAKFMGLTAGFGE
jgi:hypothetical protein